MTPTTTQDWEQRFNKKFKSFGIGLEEIFGGTSGLTEKMAAKLKTFIAQELELQAKELLELVEKEIDNLHAFGSIARDGKKIFLLRGRVLEILSQIKQNYLGEKEL